MVNSKTIFYTGNLRCAEMETQEVKYSRGTTANQKFLKKG